MGGMEAGKIDVGTGIMLLRLMGDGGAVCWLIEGTMRWRIEAGGGNGGGGRVNGHHARLRHIHTNLKAMLFEGGFSLAFRKNCFSG